MVSDYWYVQPNTFGRRINLHQIGKVTLRPDTQPTLTTFHAVTHKRFAAGPTRLANTLFSLRTAQC